MRVAGIARFAQPWNVELNIEEALVVLSVVLGAKAIVVRGESREMSLSLLT